MQLSAETISVLKNFGTINKSILIKPGQALSTTSEYSMTLMAYVEVQEQFDQQLPIYDLSIFLNIWQMFANPDLRMLSASEIEIFEDKSKVKYRLAEPAQMQKQRDPTKLIQQTGIAEFELTAVNLQTLLKMSAVLQLPNIIVRGDHSKITIEATNIKSPSSNVFTIDVGETNQSFKAVYPADHFKQMLGSYRVTISKVLAHFQAIDDKLPASLQYWICNSQESTF